MNYQNTIFKRIVFFSQRYIKIKNHKVRCVKIKVNDISQFNSYRAFSLLLLTHPARQLKFP